MPPAFNLSQDQTLRLLSIDYATCKQDALSVERRFACSINHSFRLWLTGLQFHQEQALDSIRLSTGYCRQDLGLLGFHSATRRKRRMAIYLNVNPSPFDCELELQLGFLHVGRFVET